jgi:N-acetylglutamate synthase-like GNAT family acetyltransferase
MSLKASSLPAGFTMRYSFRPGDLGSIVHLHGAIYFAECGFDVTFEAYVAEPLSVFVRSQTNRDRIWIIERHTQVVGCIAILGVSEKEAQLRWFLVDPSARGLGLGKYLLAEAVTFCRQCGYESIFLWTVSALTAGASLYRSAGFCKVEDSPAKQWGVDVVEEKYWLRF